MLKCVTLTLPQDGMNVRAGRLDWECYDIGERSVGRII